MLCERSSQFSNYVRHWPVSLAAADKIADLPYLPVSVFKANPALSLVPASEVKPHPHVQFDQRASAESGRVLDAATSRADDEGWSSRLSAISSERLAGHIWSSIAMKISGASPELGARGAAIQALGSFATEIVSCLRLDSQGELGLDLEKLLACAAKWKEAEVLVYGFTHVIWTQLVEPLKRAGITLGLPNVHVLHSGGWKRLEQQAVTKDQFVRDVASVFGCPTERIIDYYGMVENVGVVYPDCARGYKHVPAFAEVIIRDPLTLAPVEAGQQGLVQVCSVLPTSFPGFLLLTDDIGEIIGHDGCGCGRRGPHVRFLRRVPKVEVRGCGNLETTRQRRGGGA